MHQSPVSRPDSGATRLSENNASAARYHQQQNPHVHIDRPGSSDSDASSVSSRVTTLNRPKGPLRSLNPSTPSSPHPPRSSSIGGINGSANLSNVSLPTNTHARQPNGSHSPLKTPNDPVLRKQSPRAPPPELQRHRPRQHSQGFFEPSLPTASLSDHTMTALSASQIAAQAAMQSTQQYHVRHRSQTVPIEDGPRSRKGSRDSPPPAHLESHTTILASNTGTAGAGTRGFHSNTYQNGLVGSREAAATTAASIAFPRHQTISEIGIGKQKAEKTMKKLFSKPKNIGIPRDRDWIGGGSKEKGLSSPSKLGFGSSSGLSRIVSASTTNLTEVSSNNSSMYNLSNASASTVVPSDKGEKEKEKDKEKVHKHHFLSRQKAKHKELPLSSASSNSKPLDPDAPQSLYSFAPSSPGPSSSGFPKSGLDLLHGGRALREKRREEKAMVSAFEGRDSLDIDRPSGHGPSLSGSGTPYSTPSLANLGGTFNSDSIKEILQGFGLQNMSA